MSDLFHDRFSPREYTGDVVPEEELAGILETARWAQSCFNEQPWRFLIASRADGEMRETLESLLADGNAFAKEPWILGVAFAKKTFTLSGKPNQHAGFDLGAACQTLALAAFSRGWSTRFMAGFDFEKAKALCSSDFEPWAMFVIGRAASNARTAPLNRSRNEPSTYVFRAKRVE